MMDGESYSWYDVAEHGATSGQSAARLPMKLCYCDESGTGSEPYAVIVGVCVDGSRMHVSKDEWRALVDELREITPRTISEIKGVHLHRGKGPWRGVSGPVRGEVVSRIFEWFRRRKHGVVFSAVDKRRFDQRLGGAIPDELNSYWRFLGFHLTLALQKHGMGFAKPKGHTLLVFDNYEREKKGFSDVLTRPQLWSDEYYDRKSKQDQLDQIVDVPYFADSKQVELLQLADVLAFYLRRYAELKDAGAREEYNGEIKVVSRWVEAMLDRSIGYRFMYPRAKRNSAVQLFYEYAPPSIRSL